MSKLRYMLEQPEYPAVLVTNGGGSENPSGGVNQQATDSRRCVSGASEATREALLDEKVMIWSALHSDMERQAEQETTCPCDSVFDELQSNNMDLRPSSVHHFPDSEYHGCNADVEHEHHWSYRFVI